MKNTTIILLSIVVIILLLLLYFNRKPVQNNKPDREIEKQRVEDSVKQIHELQVVYQQEIDSVKSELINVVDNKRNDSIQFKKIITELRIKLKERKTPEVEEVIKTNESVRTYISTLDTTIQTLELRIDSLEIQIITERNIRNYIEAKQSTLITAKTSEAEFLYKELNKRDSTITKLDDTIENLEKRDKKKNWLIGFFALLNLVPRD